MRRAHLLCLALALALASEGGRFGNPADGDPTPADLPAADSPLGVVLRLGRAYANLQLEPYGQTLTQDFRFTFAEPELRARHPAGFTRDDEVASAAHLFSGFTSADGVHRPAARFIEVRLDSPFVLPDPDHPGAPERYRLVVVPQGSIHVAFAAGGSYDSAPRRHEFYCVRGDDAVLGQGQPADLDHWYVRRWDELDDGTIAARP
jgi:hypothetical protein